MSEHRQLGNVPLLGTVPTILKLYKIITLDHNENGATCSLVRYHSGVARDRRDERLTIGFGELLDEEAQVSSSPGSWSIGELKLFSVFDLLKCHKSLRSEGTMFADSHIHFFWRSDTLPHQLCHVCSRSPFPLLSRAFCFDQTQPVECLDCGEKPFITLCVCSRGSASGILTHRMHSQAWTGRG